jgi:hypothetical protein
MPPPQPPVATPRFASLEPVSMTFKCIGLRLCHACRQEGNSSASMAANALPTTLRSSWLLPQTVLHPKSKDTRKDLTTSSKVRRRRSFGDHAAAAGAGGHPAIRSTPWQTMLSNTLVELNTLAHPASIRPSGGPKSTATARPRENIPAVRAADAAQQRHRAHSDAPPLPLPKPKRPPGGISEDKVACESAQEHAEVEAQLGPNGAPLGYVSVSDFKELHEVHMSLKQELAAHGLEVRGGLVGGWKFRVTSIPAFLSLASASCAPGSPEALCLVRHFPQHSVTIVTVVMVAASQRGSLGSCLCVFCAAPPHGIWTTII